MSFYQSFGPCMCAATDCPSCGPAQGYSGNEDDDDCDCEHCQALAAEAEAEHE